MMTSFEFFILQLLLLLQFYQHPVVGQTPVQDLEDGLRANNHTGFADFLLAYPGWENLLVAGAQVYAVENEGVASFLAGNPEIHSSVRLVKRADESSPPEQFGRPRSRAVKLIKRDLEIPEQGEIFETADGGIDSTRVLKRSTTGDGETGTVYTGDGVTSNVSTTEIFTIDVPEGEVKVYSVTSFFQKSGEISKSISNGANGIEYLSKIFSRDSAALESLLAARAVTFLVPTEEAFNASGLNVETSTDEELLAVLNYHIIIDSHVLYTPSIRNASSYTTESGKKFVATWDGGDTFYINDARIVLPDRITSNGVIQIIDKVLTPPGDDATTVPGPYGPLPLGQDPSTTVPPDVPPQATNAATIATGNQLLSGLAGIFVLAGLNLF